MTELPDPALPNTLTSRERDAAASAMRAFADILTGEASEGATDAERAKLDAIAADTRAAADSLSEQDIPFSLAAEARHALGTTLETVEVPPGSLPQLAAAAAKLDDAVRAAAPRRAAAAVARRVAEHGFAVQYVGGQGEPLPAPAFQYTIGLQIHGHPELAIVSAPADWGHELLTVLARRVLDGERLLAGEILAGLAAGDLRLRVHAASDFLRRELRFAYVGDQPPDALQIVWPDEQGVLPGEPDCDERYARSQVMPDLPDGA